MFFERGGHEFFGRESTLSGSLQLRMIHCVNPVHKFALALAGRLPVAPRREIQRWVWEASPVMGTIPSKVRRG